MKNRKIESKRRYLYAFLIGTAIFITGFAITYSVAYFEFQRVTNLQGPTSYQIFQDRLQYTFFGKDICEENSFADISRDLNYQGRIIGDMETKFGKDDEGVLFRKKFYTLIQLEHLEFVSIVNEECGKDRDIILFFYSNKKEYLEKSEKLGELLGVIYQKNREDLALYSIDLNLDSDILESLREKYGVENEPVIILNEDQRFTDIHNINEIEKLLN